MRNTENVMALLTEANPIPDVAALERRPQFDRAGLTEVVPSRDTSASSGGVRWALVPAVIAILLMVTFVFATRSNKVDPVETIPGPTLPSTSTTAAPTTTSTPPSPQSLEGAWDAASYSLVFADGRYAVETSDLAVDTGTYEHEDDELTLVSDDSSASCPAGAEARFIVGLSTESLDLEPIEDDCGLDRGIGVGTKSLEPGEATEGFPRSVLDVTRPISELAGRPGRFITGRFTPGFSLAMPPGWTFDAATLSPDVDYRTSVREDDERIVWYRHDHLDNPAAVYDQFAAESVVEASEPSPTALTGFDGITFDYVNNFEFPEDAQFGNSLMSAPGIGVGSPKAPGHYRWRAWALDVDGAVVTIVASFDPETMPEKSVEVEKILNSIVWTD